jgi:pilus assembly protein Flp/PilA
MLAPKGPIRHRLVSRHRTASQEGQEGSSVRNHVGRFLKDETAATAIEYGLIAAGIALLIIPTIKGLGTKLNTSFTSINTQLR